MIEWARSHHSQVVILRESGVSSTPRPLGDLADVPVYWITRFRG
jgi:hypothetical protein